MNRYRAWGLALGVLLSIPAVVYAVAETYSTGGPGRTWGEHRGGTNITSTGDSKSSTTFSDAQATNGDPTVVVSPRMTVAGATVCVSVWLLEDNNAGTYTLMDISGVQTATASTVFRAGSAGNYLPTSPLTFDTMGADAYEVRYHDVSSGEVEPYARTAGDTSGVAE